jgi:hypothetical protein
MADERTYGFNADDAAALVQSIGTNQASYQETKPRGGGGRVQVILTSDLAAAVNTKRDPSTATARILRRKADGDLSLSTTEITIVNRFKNISIDSGTYAKVEMIDGEWQPYAADCPGGSLSESL